MRAPGHEQFLIVAQRLQLADGRLVVMPKRPVGTDGLVRPEAQKLQCLDPHSDGGGESFAVRR